jgi:hypothetical protein
VIEIDNIPTARPELPVKRTPSTAQAQVARQGCVNLVNLALMIWMIWDIRHHTDEEINGKRKLWMLAAFAPPIGPIAYFIFGRKRRVPVTEVLLEAGE